MRCSLDAWGDDRVHVLHPSAGLPCSLIPPPSERSRRALPLIPGGVGRTGQLKSMSA